MREVIMGYQGEMSLKGLNRNQFESTMMKIRFIRHFILVVLILSSER